MAPNTSSKPPGKSSSTQNPFFYVPHEEEPSSKKLEFQKKLEVVFDHLYRVLAVFLFIGALIASLRIIDFGFSLVYPLKWLSALGIVLVLLLRDKINFAQRTAIILILTFAYGVISFFFWGPHGSGVIVFTACILFATLAGRMAHGVYFSIAAVVAMAITAALHIQGWLHMPGFNHEVEHPSLWISRGLELLILGVIVSLLAGKLKEYWLQFLEELEDSERDYRLIAENISDVIWTTDLDGNLTFASPSIKRITGYTPEEAISMNLGAILTGEAFEKAKDLLKQSLATGTASLSHRQSYKATLEVTKKNGKTVWTETQASLIRDAAKKPIGVLGMSRDISDRRAVEEELRKLAAITEQASEGVALTDLDGIVEYVNPAFERMTGYAHQEIAGKPINILKSGVHDQSFYKNLWDALTRTGEWEGQIVNRRKDGSHYTEYATIAPLRNTSGTKVGYLAIKRDITKQIEMEEELQQARKMEAVGQLAGGIAHDFNNLLQVIMGYSEMMLWQTPEGLESREPLEEVMKAAKRGKNLVSQLLAFSRRETLDLKSINPNWLIQDVCGLVTDAIGDEISLSLHLMEDLPDFKADTNQMKQVFMNLTENAREAMPNGGKLVIETAMTEVDTTFASVHPEAKPGNYVSFSFADSGTGIAPDIQKRIFEPFFTRKGVGEGSGLGLATAYAIVKRHGGFITLSSQEGIGSTFKIHLPLPAGTAPGQGPSTQSAHSQNSISGMGHTILVADDEEQVRNLIQTILNQAGFEIIMAQDGEQAIQLYEEHQERIDLALLDAVMPKYSGVEVFNRIRQVDPDLPVLFASGYTYDILEQSHLPDQDLTLIRKPFEQTKLLHAVLLALNGGQ